MDKRELQLQIRARKLGVLILDARLASRRSVEECAHAMNVTVEEYTAYEKGLKSPSLPQVEALAFALNIPYQHFWSSEALSEKPQKDALEKIAQLIQLRNRIIATRIRMERSRLNLTIPQMAEKSGISEESLKVYESGAQTIPSPELENIAAALSMRMEDFFDQSGPIGKWRSEQESIQNFLQLSDEVQRFVSKPVNQPYLSLAMRLSDLSVEKLRAVAEGLLEITY